LGREWPRLKVKKRGYCCRFRRPSQSQPPWPGF